MRSISSRSTFCLRWSYNFVGLAVGMAGNALAISSGLSVLQVIRNRFYYLNSLNSYESLVNTNP